jgi:hypothetical protein
VGEATAKEEIAEQALREALMWYRDCKPESFWGEAKDWFTGEGPDNSSEIHRSRDAKVQAVIAIRARFVKHCGLDGYREQCTFPFKSKASSFFSLLLGSQAKRQKREKATRRNFPPGLWAKLCSQNCSLLKVIECLPVGVGLHSLHFLNKSTLHSIRDDMLWQSFFCNRNRILHGPTRSYSNYSLLKMQSNKPLMWDGNVRKLSCRF